MAVSLIEERVLETWHSQEREAEAKSLFFQLQYESKLKSEKIANLEVSEFLDIFR